MTRDELVQLVQKLDQQGASEQEINIVVEGYRSEMTSPVKHTSETDPNHNPYILHGEEEETPEVEDTTEEVATETDAGESLPEIQEVDIDLLPVNTPSTKTLEPEQILSDKLEDIDADYKYQRENFYNLIEKGTNAIEGILEIAKESDHPRTYEVAGNLIKQVAEVTEKLGDLQDKMKKLKDVPNNAPKNVTNALFVGSTAELQKMLKGKKNA